MIRKLLRQRRPLGVIPKLMYVVEISKTDETLQTFPQSRYIVLDPTNGLSDYEILTQAAKKAK